MLNPCVPTMSYLPRAKTEIKHRSNFRRNRIDRLRTEYYYLKQFFLPFFSPGQSIRVLLPNTVFTFSALRSSAKFDATSVSFRLSAACHRHCPDAVSRRKCLSFCYGHVGGSNSLARFNTASRCLIDSTLYVRIIFIWRHNVSNTVFVPYRMYAIDREGVEQRGINLWSLFSGGPQS